ncbi:hypothetical protein LEP1GSC151_0575 [Leptospira interrogans serovar Grippotyphosa str. LT2186]|uniref:Uncharacterized protein n=3 Tax=Leptospira interrogans TaxID=173 RepID=M3H2U8_LEPIR|nr:hypothetical protein LEP1GSC080_0075 [Leptospira interrogans str. FPW2026]EKO23402.1 hypothetical protein LEP1GSC104_0867 [Leptospira interrogans str. UI 12621]EMG13303.1 hypothetical protein LEP1GSC151_0575 [Leptospira interrogans serovar Grippotyphosa str. LT2186]EMM80240.1 hypothetical protein LEP1GSC037_0476 [Leptospira interrogans str. 2006001854]EMN65268.1 hypothetical protein LEP1GSC098_0043 [Leptospira interrogans serovar Grippotyphosa str. UI 08434]
MMKKTNIHFPKADFLSLSIAKKKDQKYNVSLPLGETI